MPFVGGIVVISVADWNVSSLEKKFLNESLENFSSY